MKILTVLGARPQFIKAATISRVIEARSDIEEIIVHTGQHFDPSMSDVFFNQLNIPKPQHNLGISSLSHGAMTGRMVEAIEALIQKELPDYVLVYGDTNSTLAGSLAAAKLHVPVAHVEAGLRSRNPQMPEEINRVICDRLSSLLFCPTENAIENLRQEGFPFFSPTNGSRISRQLIVNVGDIMYDAVLYYKDIVKQHINLDDFQLKHNSYALCTIHRQENTDDSHKLTDIFNALSEISVHLPVVVPLHPRTKSRLERLGLADKLSNIIFLAPVPYLEMQRLQMSARFILTDSGGVQKEAYFYGVPCITLREETEWVETVQSGWNKTVGSDMHKILNAVNSLDKLPEPNSGVYGNGHAAEKILSYLLAN